MASITALDSEALRYLLDLNPDFWSMTVHPPSPRVMPEPSDWEVNDDALELECKIPEADAEAWTAGYKAGWADCLRAHGLLVATVDLNSLD